MYPENWTDVQCMAARLNYIPLYEDVRIQKVHLNDGCEGKQALV